MYRFLFLLSLEIMTIVLYDYYYYYCYYDYDHYYYHYFDKNNGSLYTRCWKLYNPDIIISFYMHIDNYHHFIATLNRLNYFNLIYFILF